MKKFYNIAHVKPFFKNSQNKQNLVEIIIRLQKIANMNRKVKLSAQGPILQPFLLL
jgi:hypothetical protein